MFILFSPRLVTTSKTLALLYLDTLTIISLNRLHILKGESTSLGASELRSAAALHT